VVAAREMGATPASDGEGEDGRVVSATAVGATEGVAREAEAAARARAVARAKAARAAGLTALPSRGVNPGLAVLPNWC